MKRTPLFLALLTASFLTACGGDSDPPCSCAGEIRPACVDECAPEGDSPENVGKALSALSLSASAFYSIAYASGYGPSTAAYCNDPAVSTWCECNVVYSDAAPRCNEPSATTVWEFPAPACVVSAATLTYIASASVTGHTVDLRRILRPVATPPMGIAGSCVSASVASWWRSGPEAWTSPGAKGDGTDRTAAGVSRVIVTTAQHLESFDVTALVQGCPASGACVLAQFADAHVYVHPGAVLDITCGAPTVCGDGVTEGAEGCDDGAAVAGDGCSTACAVESGYACTGAPPACETTCGAGVEAGNAACDDGNLTSSDGCSAACVLESCSLVCE